MDFDLYENGGMLRDELLGIESKDMDYTAVDRHPDPINVMASFSKLGHQLGEDGYDVFKVDPKTFTIRAKFPKGDPRERTTADFVLARKDGPYSDRRHPDWVVPGTLFDDLARRDFTVNAMARSMDGDFIDLFGGKEDIRSRTLRFVGDPEQRLMEDALRAFRLLRFSITKNMKVDPEALRAVVGMEYSDFDAVSNDRIVVELDKCFKFDTFRTFCALNGEFVRLGILSFFLRDILIIPSLKTKGRKKD